MSLNPKVRNCTHIKVTGVRCGSPALRDEQFCYFHQRMLRSVKTPPNTRLHSIALIEDEEAIQASLMEVINALARNHIDLRRADLILKALHIAVKNSRRARFNVDNNRMVREVPEYAAPPAPAQTQVAAVAAAAAMDAAAGASGALGARGTPAVSEAQAEVALPSRTLQSGTASTKVSVQIDPTQRKPPARAGIPPTTKQVAVNQRQTRT